MDKRITRTGKRGNMVKVYIEVEETIRKPIEIKEPIEFANPCSDCICYKCTNKENGENSEEICRGRSEMFCGNCRGTKGKFLCDNFNKKVFTNRR